MRRRWLGLAGLLAACALPPPPPPRPAPPERIALIAAERGPSGARLVSIDEHGDRRAELVKPATRLVRDTHPAVSPDGKWLVFASSRDRSLDQTSLWIAALGVTAPPRRLTRGDAIDAHPTWTPDGAAIVFASTRAAGQFDLWRLAIRDGEAGALTRLTSAPGHEVTPTVAGDGTIFYAEVTPVGDTREVESHLEARAPDGAIRRVTEGRADSSPALSPDGARLVFARPQLHDGKLDAELWIMPRAGGAAVPLVDLPLTDESGPVWSRDGRFLFATSVLRGDGERVLWSSIIDVDLAETPAVARILEDRVGAIIRMTPAVTATPLDARALHAGKPYLAELAEIMRRELEKQTRQRAEP